MGPKLFGIEPMAVMSGSMEPAYHTGSLVYVNTKSRVEDVKVGEVITFRVTDQNGEDIVVTHRVVGVDTVARAFQTQGDNNNAPDNAPVLFEKFIGAPVYTVPNVGFVVANLNTKKGFAAICIIAAVMIMLFIVPMLLRKDDDEDEEEEVDIAPADQGSGQAENG
jgi:signal peptidase